jgi:CheY-like chemotaxis protein
MTNPQGRSVLVVEDNDTTRARISGLLRARGYAVTEALDGLDALKKVSGQPFDAILLDLMLPHVDGWQFRATQMRHPELADIPTIVVTIRPLQEHDRYALRTADVIHKPFEDDALASAVERACAQAPPRIGSAPTVNPDALFWSRRGEVACAAHAPEAVSDRWRQEQWAPIPVDAGKGRIVYQCQHCEDRRTPIAHNRRGSGS